jgi:DNA-directed RNA polymerase specialized sigma24 family protein
VSALLDIVSEARELMQAAQDEYQKAVRRARAGGHSLQEIGRAAGITKQSVSKALRREERGES